MATWGYWRCSTDAQDEERQIKALTAAGCERLFEDKITGTSNYGDREQLSRCLDGLRAGDLLVLDELSRLGRSMVEMLVEVNALLERNITNYELEAAEDLHDEDLDQIVRALKWPRGDKQHFVTITPFGFIRHVDKAAPKNLVIQMSNSFLDLMLKSSDCD